MIPISTDTFIQTAPHQNAQYRYEHFMDSKHLQERFIHFKKREEIFLSLTAVGYSKTVRHFQIVNVGRQSEFRGAKLNHSYPKCAVLLIRAPWKESP